MMTGPVIDQSSLVPIQSIDLAFGLGANTDVPIETEILHFPLPRMDRVDPSNASGAADVGEDAGRFDGADDQ